MKKSGEELSLSVGDVVELKSGSSSMTIVEVIEEMAMCIWESRDGEIRQRRFPLSTLQLRDSGYVGMV